jgi:DNA-binding response OmpR family regulator
VERTRALVVDDAVEYRELLTELLDGAGFEVRAEAGAKAALAVTERFAPDVVVLDLDLRGAAVATGIELCGRIRALTDAYVVVVSARAGEEDKLRALAAGADDYVTKPFSPRELLARIHAMLRRPRRRPAQARRVGRITIDAAAREVTVDGRPLELSPIEFDLLDALAEHPRVALTRRQLLDRVWGPNWFGDAHVVDVHVSSLRRKLGDRDRSLVRTVRGVGYRLDSA